MAIFEIGGLGLLQPLQHALPAMGEVAFGTDVSQMEQMLEGMLVLAYSR